MWSLPSSRGSDEHVRTENVESDAPAWCNFQRAGNGHQVGSPVAAAAARPHAAGSKLTQEHLQADCRRSGEPVEPDGSAGQRNSQCAGGPSVGGERDSPAGPRNTAACDDASRVPRQSSAHSDDAARAPARTTMRTLAASMCIIVLVAALTAAVNTLPLSIADEHGRPGIYETLVAEFCSALTSAARHFSGSGAAQERGATARPAPAPATAPRARAPAAAPPPTPVPRPPT